MTLLQIRYFLEVAATKNYTSAAADLYTSQPNLSRQIMNLEDELGTALLIRDKQHVALTKAGEVFRDQFKIIMQEMETAAAAVRASGTPHTRTIRIGILQIFDNYTVTNLVSDLHMGLPDSTAQVFRYPFAELIAAFAEQRIDIAAVPDYMSVYFSGNPGKIFHRQHWNMIYVKNCFSWPDPSFADFNGKVLVTLQQEIAPGLREEQLRLLQKLEIVPRKVIAVGNIGSYFILDESPENLFTVNMMDTLGAKSDEMDVLPIPAQNGNFCFRAIWHNDADLPFGQIIQEV